MSTKPVSFEKYLTDRRVSIMILPPPDRGEWVTRYDAYIVLMSSGNLYFISYLFK
jgi:hypothetical protein